MKKFGSLAGSKDCLDWHPGIPWDFIGEGQNRHEQAVLVLVVSRKACER